METVLGWMVIGSLLGVASGCLVLPLLRLVERRWSVGRPTRLVRAAAVAAGGMGLWYAIPTFVQVVYLRP